MAQKPPLDDIAAGLTARLTDIRATLQSAKGVHDSLAELYILLAQDRVSPRRAAVLAYLSSLLLRSLENAEKSPASSSRPKPPVKIIWDLPHPPREDEHGTESEGDAQQRPSAAHAAGYANARSRDV